MSIGKSVQTFGFALMLVLLAAGMTACGSRDQGATPEPPPAAETPVAETEETGDNASPTAPAEATAAVAEAPAAAAPEAGAAQSAVGLRTFRIIPEGTEARFYIDEVLLGQDKTVIGVTSQVTGELAVDPADPGSARVGTIQINARDFVTDNSRRNTAIQRFVLQSARDEYQYIVFEPTAVEGMPAAVAVGEPVEFTMTGNLTIRDITQPETFTVSVTPVSEEQIEGLARTTVLRSTYELTIPSVPSVANVSEEVHLELQFTASAAE